MKSSAHRRGTSDKKTKWRQNPKADLSNAPLDRALEHLRTGQWAEAERLLRQVLQSHPDQPVALHYLGVLAFQSGHVERALKFIEKAVDAQPDYGEALCNLGVMYLSAGRIQEAQKRCADAVRLQPGSAAARFGLANALKAQGRLEDAVQVYGQTLDLHPSYAEAWFNLANTHYALGQLDAAAESYRQALNHAPGYADAHNNLGLVLKAGGQATEAVACHRRALALDPKRDVFWTAFAACVKSISFSGADTGLTQDLMRLLDHVSTKPNTLIEPLVSVLRFDAQFAHLLRLSTSNEATPADYVLAADRLSGVPLLLKLMRLCPISKPDVERALTAVRRALVLKASTGPLNGASLPFVATLAVQCFVNEYVFAETSQETQALERLGAQVEKGLAEGEDVAPSHIAVLAAYRPLLHWVWGAKLGERAWPQEVKMIVDCQVREPLKERALQAEIKSLTPIENSVSQDVRGQYEENPYPRWVKAGLYSAPLSLDAILRKSALDWDAETYQAPENPDILIAGCGTGQQSLEAASYYAKSRILAVDLSLSSLAYAKRKALECGYTHVEYAQADILELGALTRRFDLIESIGVLHHLADPQAGWRALCQLLRPGGLMFIALYSELGRQSVVEGRRLVAENGYGNTPADIRTFRQEMFARERATPKTNTNLSKLIKSNDFYSLSECRDLIFHVQEHRFSLMQIERMLKDLDLKFLGFEGNDSATLSAFKHQNPAQGDLTNLALWHNFEQNNPDTFSGMYQFWCQKSS